MRLLYVILPMMLLGACASPDVGSFQKSTVALTVRIDENQKLLASSATTVADSFGDLSFYSSAAGPAGAPSQQQQLATLKTQVSKLTGQSKQIRQLTLVLVSYADSIAKLAQAGDDGTKAALDLKSNLESTISQISGSQTTLPNSITTLADVAGRLVQLGKNKELYEIMDTAAVKNAINGVADGLSSTMLNADTLIVSGLVDFWRLQRADLRNGHKAYRALERQIATIERSAGFEVGRDTVTCVNNANCDYDALLQTHQSKQKERADEIGKIKALMEELKTTEEGYQAREAEIAEWQQETLAHLAGIKSLSAAWKKDHQTIISYLKDCTGFSGIFKKKCDAFSAANLELFGKLVGGSFLPL